LDSFKAFFEIQEHFQLDGGNAGKLGKVRFLINIGSSWKFAPDPTSTIDDGNWHHIVGVYDGAKIHLYQDGTEQGTGTSQTGNITWSADKVLRIAADAGNGYNPDCEMDEVAIWDRVLSSAEITTLYNGGLGYSIAGVDNILKDIIQMGFIPFAR